MNVTGFGDRLAKARKDTKLTQEELSAKLGVTPQAVSKWERDAGYPDIDTLHGIAQVLNCSIDILLDIKKDYSKHLIESDDEKRKAQLLREIISEPLKLEVGLGFVDSLIIEGENKYEKLALSRERLAIDNGILMPAVRIIDNVQLDNLQYKIYIYDKCMRDEVIETENAFQLMCNHISDICRNNYAMLLNKNMVKVLVDNVKEKYPFVVEGVIPEKISLLQLQKVLGKLVERKVSIRNIIKIIEYMEEMLEITSDTDQIVEYIIDKL